MSWILYNFNIVPYYLLIFSIIISFLLFTFLLEGFNFSENKIIKFIQKILILILLYIVIQSLLFTFGIGVVYASGLSPEDTKNVTDIIKGKEISLSTNVVVDAQGAEVISQGIKSAVGQIGLGASIGGVSAAVSSVVKGTSMPVGAKCGCIVAAGLAGGLIHTCSSALSKVLADNVNSTNNSMQSSSNTNSSSNVGVASDLDLNSGGYFNTDWISNLLSDNPVEVALYSFYGINVICLLLVFFLSVFLLSKYLVDKKLKLDIIDRLIPESYNKKVKNNILKVIDIYSKTNNLYIVLCLVTLLICLLFSNYFLISFISNFESFCKFYLKL